MRARDWIFAPALIAAGVITAGTVAPDAKADGVLSAVEVAYVNAYGPIAVCPTLDNHPSTSGVLGIAEAITDDGFGADDAIDIINASVYEYCPRHWPLLVAIGQAARAGHSATYQAGAHTEGQL